MTKTAEHKSAPPSHKLQRTLSASSKPTPRKNNVRKPPRFQREVLANNLDIMNHSTKPKNTSRPNGGHDLEDKMNGDKDHYKLMASRDGVKLDAMMESLLGVQFLPFVSPVATASKSEFASAIDRPDDNDGAEVEDGKIEGDFEDSMMQVPSIDFEFHSQESVSSTDDIPEMEEEGDVEEENEDYEHYRKEEENDDKENKQKKLRRRKGPKNTLKSIRKGLSLRNEKRRTKRLARKTRKMQRNNTDILMNNHDDSNVSIDDDLNYTSSTRSNPSSINVITTATPHHEVFEDLSMSIENQLSQVEQNRKKLNSIKSKLTSVHKQTDRVVASAQTVSNRVNKISKTVASLEYKLDMEMQSLEKERSKLDSNLAVVQKLDNERKLLESEARSVERMLEERLLFVERLNSALTVAGGINDASNTNDSVLSFGPRYESDHSFNTAICGGLSRNASFSDNGYPQENNYNASAPTSTSMENAKLNQSCTMPENQQKQGLPKSVAPNCKTLPFLPTLDCSPDANNDIIINSNESDRLAPSSDTESSFITAISGSEWAQRDITSSQSCQSLTSLESGDEGEVVAIASSQKVSLIIPSVLTNQIASQPKAAEITTKTTEELTTSLQQQLGKKSRTLLNENSSVLTASPNDNGISHDYLMSPASANDQTVVTSPSKRLKRENQSLQAESKSSEGIEENGLGSGRKVRRKQLSSFLRIHDLDLPKDLSKHLSSLSSCASTQSEVSTQSEIFMGTEEKGEFQHKDGSVEILPTNNRSDLFSLDREDRHIVLDALVKRSLEYATDEGPRWSPDKSTEKIIAKRTPEERKWHFTTGKKILVWTGKFDDGGFGSDIPVIKARGIVQGTPREVVDLVLDSTKVKNYNKMSLGRTDKFFYQRGLDSKNEGRLNGEAKIIRSVSKPPIIRKQIELLSLLYARKLSKEIDGVKGYILVSRSIWENEERAPSEKSNGQQSSSGNDPFIRSEMLLGVNLIRELEGENSGCSEFTTITHCHTPCMPTFGAKHIAIKASANFIQSIQSIFE